MFQNIYRQRRVLITGHTGFKGSWLALWLNELQAAVTGFALAPVTQPSHWDLLQLPVRDVRGDIRQLSAVSDVIRSAQPEIVFHLAAQPLVRRSYRDPLETWTTNAIGTANVLEACRQAGGVRAIVVVTTDKCYLNREHARGYTEADPLGGHDPYSASKAAAELVAASYRQSYFSGVGSPLLATARAGNVIGGGDWSEDRLIPDAVRAVAAGQSLEIRSPQATRPWQHVLESLSGYLLLGQLLLQGQVTAAEAWNFGPGAEGNRTVASVLQSLQACWPELCWHPTAVAQPHEATLLQLDSSKARQTLAWQPVWSLDQGLHRTAEWYYQFAQHSAVVSAQQLQQFISDARDRGAVWASG